MQGLRLCLLVVSGLWFIGAGAAVPTADTYSVALQRKNTGTFYISGAIKGYGELDLLVDTGSSNLVIGQTILEELLRTENAHFSHELSGTMADGSQRKVPVYRISALRLGENCWIHDVEAAVFPTGARAILGMNILAKLAPFTFSAEPPQLLLNQCQGAATGTLPESVLSSATNSAAVAQ